MMTARRKPEWMTTHQENHLRLLAWEWDTGRRSEWYGEIEGLELSDVKDNNGVPYVQATLRGCVTAFGLTRDQALHNLDVAARAYTERLSRVPSSPHGNWQLSIMRNYLAERDTGCPCAIAPCECERDEVFAYG